MISPTVLRYEKSFATYLGIPSAHTFWKGRVALYAILKAMRIGPGDEVILPGFTCVVVPNAVRFTGATPIYADIVPGTYNIDPEAIVKRITPNTRAIVVQHTFGIAADLRALTEIARQHSLALIEDCAHALGSTYDGRLLGTFGDAAFFSSQWSKPYTTGLGGVAVTSDAELAKRLETVQSTFAEPSIVQRVQIQLQHALYQKLFSPRLYWFALGVLRRLSRLGLFVGSSGNAELRGSAPVDTIWRMSAAQARVGLVQIHKLPLYLAHRHQLTDRYSDLLCSRGWSPEITSDQATTAYLRYPIRVGNKDALLRAASMERVELGSWFETVLHPIRQSLETFGYQPGQCPIAERTAQSVVNLPLHPRVASTEAERIVAFIARMAQPAPA